MNGLETILITFVYLIAAGVIIGVMCGIPVMLVGAALWVFAKLTRQKQETDLDAPLAEDIKVSNEVLDEVYAAIKDYNIKDNKKKMEIFNELLRQRGYMFNEGKLVRV